MATCSCAVHSAINEASKESDSCSNVGPVLKRPSFAQDHFPHSELARRHFNLARWYTYNGFLCIQIIFRQSLSFIYLSITSWWCAMDIAWVIPAISSNPDHKVSKILPSTSPEPLTKLRENFRKHSRMWAARCHFPTAQMISKESHSSRDSDSDMRCQKWMLYWQQMS